jgi:hypothetical protein
MAEGSGLAVKPHRTYWRAVPLLGALTIVFGVSFAQGASASTGGAGWVRLADLSETLTPVDMYVVSSSGATVATEKNLSYGSVESRPLTLPAGSYTVEVRDAGAPASSGPAASAKITVAANMFYTVAPVEVNGSGSSREVIDLPDKASTPSGDAEMQAIDAAYQNGSITFHCNYEKGTGGNVLTSVKGGTADTGAMPAGTWTATATGSNGKTASTPLTLAANTSRTEIILDTTTGLQVLNLMDMVGDSPAKGSVTTGLAPVTPGPGSPLPWVALIGAGGVLVAGGGVRLARRRNGHG